MNAAGACVLGLALSLAPSACGSEEPSAPAVKAGRGPVGTPVQDGRDDDECPEDSYGTVSCPDGLSFDFTLDVLEPEPTSRSEDGFPVVVEHRTRYWVDIQNGIPNCTQVVRLEGRAYFGRSVTDRLGETESCPAFSGYVELDPDTYEDISNPEVDPDHCWTSELEVVGRSYGERMLTPTNPDAYPATYGDFLRLAWLDASTQEELDLSLRSGDGSDVVALRAEAEAEGRRYVGAAFVDPASGTLASDGGLDQVTNSPPGDCSWLAAFSLWTDGTDGTDDYEASAADTPPAIHGDAEFILTLGGGW